MIKLSAKQLAFFIDASPKAQRRMLEKIKEPAPDVFNPALYYQPARNAIKQFHRQNRPVAWLNRKSESLFNDSAQAQGRAAARLMLNANAMRQYANYYGDRDYDVQENLRMRYSHSGVAVLATPDLFVVDVVARNRERVIKLDFKIESLESPSIRIVTQVYKQAADLAGLSLSCSDIIYIHVPSGELTSGMRHSVRIQEEIDAACMNIAGMWDSI